MEQEISIAPLRLVSSSDLWKIDNRYSSTRSFKHLCSKFFLLPFIIVITTVVTIYKTISELCGDSEECVASNYCPPVLNLMLGKIFSGDPEQRGELERNLNERKCRGKQNRTDSFCCLKFQKSETDLSAKFGMFNNFVAFSQYLNLSNNIQ